MAIASGGGIEALASLLGSEAAVEAAETLANLAKDEQNTVALPPKKQFFWFNKIFKQQIHQHFLF